MTGQGAHGGQLRIRVSARRNLAVALLSGMGFDDRWRSNADLLVLKTAQSGAASATGFKRRTEIRSLMGPFHAIRVRSVPVLVESG